MTAASISHDRRSKPGWLDATGRHLRLGVRTLARRRAFTAVAMGTFALGVGAVTAAYALLESVVLSPLPYEAPDQLVRLYLHRPDHRQPDLRIREFLSSPYLHALRTEAGAFQELSAVYAYRELGADWTEGDVPMRVSVLPSSVAYFDVLGVAPALGRTFTAEDEGSAVVVLSHRAWRAAAAADPEIAGRSILLDGVAHTVVGVMPPGFRGPLFDADVWQLMDMRPAANGSRPGEWRNNNLGAVARLIPGTSLSEAQAKVDAFAAALPRDIAGPYGLGIRLVPLRTEVLGSTDITLWTVMATAAFLLLVAWVNVVNLFLARGLGRRQELATRHALGATRTDLLVPGAVEGALIAGAGGMIGLGLGRSMLLSLSRFSADGLPRMGELSMDPSIVLGSLVLTLCSGLLLGSAPALPPLTGGSRRDHALTGPPAVTGRRHRSVGRALIVVQLAAAVVLVAGAGLSAKSYRNLRSIPLGMDPDGVVAFGVNLPDARYVTPERRIEIHADFQARISALPGVHAAGATDWLPMRQRYHPWGYRRLDLPEDHEGSTRGIADVRVVMGDFFAASGLTVLRGRPFRATDDGRAPGVAVISQGAVAERYAETDPIGRWIDIRGRTFEIVGIVADVPFDARGRTVPIVYLPHDQIADNRNWALTYLVSVDGRSAPVVAGARAALAAVDPDLVLYRPHPLKEDFTAMVGRERLAMLIMAAFAFVALVLVIVGVYGVTSQIVHGRVPEIGVRTALGAERRQVIGLILREVALLAGVGTGIGVLTAVVLTRGLRSILFEVDPLDPAVFWTVSLATLLTAIAAGAIPAKRASQVEPVAALRSV